MTQYQWFANNNLLGTSEVPLFTTTIPNTLYGNTSPSQISFNAKIGETETANQVFVDVYPPIDGVWSANQTGNFLNPNWLLKSGAHLTYEVYYADIFNPYRWIFASNDPFTQVQVPDANPKVSKIIVKDPANQEVTLEDVKLPQLIRDISSYNIETVSTRVDDWVGGKTWFGYRKYYRGPNGEIYGMSWPQFWIPLVTDVPYGNMVVDRLAPTFENILTYPMWQFFSDNIPAGEVGTVYQGIGYYRGTAVASVFDSGNCQFFVDGGTVYVFNLVNGSMAWSEGFYPYSYVWDYMLFENNHCVTAGWDGPIPVLGDKAYDPVSKVFYSANGPEGVSFQRVGDVLTTLPDGYWPKDPRPSWWNQQLVANVWYNNTTKEVLWKINGTTYATDPAFNLTSPIDDTQPSQDYSEIFTSDGDRWTSPLTHYRKIPANAPGWTSWQNFRYASQNATSAPPTDGNQFVATLGTNGVFELSEISTGVVQFIDRYDDIVGQKTYTYDRTVSYHTDLQIVMPIQALISGDFSVAFTFAPTDYCGIWNKTAHARYYLLLAKQGQELTVNLNSPGHVALFRYQDSPMWMAFTSLVRFSIAEDGYYFLEFAGSSAWMVDDVLSIDASVRLSNPPTPIQLTWDVPASAQFTEDIKSKWFAPNEAVVFSLDIEGPDDLPIWEFHPTSGGNNNPISLQIYQDVNGYINTFYRADLTGSDEFYKEAFYPPEYGTYLIELAGGIDQSSFNFTAHREILLPQGIFTVQCDAATSQILGNFELLKGSVQSYEWSIIDNTTGVTTLLGSTTVPTFEFPSNLDYESTNFQLVVIHGYQRNTFIASLDYEMAIFRLGSSGDNIRWDGSDLNGSISNPLSMEFDSHNNRIYFGNWSAPNSNVGYLDLNNLNAYNFACNGPRQTNNNDPLLDGPPDTATASSVMGMRLGPDGYLYIVDQYQHYNTVSQQYDNELYLRKVDSLGNTTTLLRTPYISPIYNNYCNALGDLAILSGGVGNPIIYLTNSNSIIKFQEGVGMEVVYTDNLHVIASIDRVSDTQLIFASSGIQDTQTRQSSPGTIKVLDLTTNLVTQQYTLSRDLPADVLIDSNTTPEAYMCSFPARIRMGSDGWIYGVSQNEGFIFKLQMAPFNFELLTNLPWAPYAPHPVNGYTFSDPNHNSFIPAWPAILDFPTDAQLINGDIYFTEWNSSQGITRLKKRRSTDPIHTILEAGNRSSEIGAIIDSSCRCSVWDITTRARTYTFNVEEGGSIEFNLWSNNRNANYTPRMTLWDPDKVEILTILPWIGGEGSNNGRGSVYNLKAGLYTMELSTVEPVVVDYNLPANRSDEMVSVSISYMYIPVAIRFSYPTELGPITTGQSADALLSIAPLPASAHWTVSSQQPQPAAGASYAEFVDDFGNAVSSRISIANQMSADYQGLGSAKLRVTSDGATGPFDIHISANAPIYGNTKDFEGSITVTGGVPPVLPPITPITFGDTLNGSLSASSPDSLFRSGKKGDLYSFTANAGQRVTITMLGVSSNFDTYLILGNPNTLETITYDDDGAGNSNSRISSFSLPYTGEYYIDCSAYDSGEGTYTVSLTLG